MSLKIVPLKVSHLEDAAALVRFRYSKMYESEPLLPKRYKEVSNLLPLLEGLLGAAGPGVAAIQDGRMVGFLKGWMMPDFRGKRSVYSPEWGNGADLEDSRYIYEEMYRHIAADWVADQTTAHYISLFPNDLDAVQGWHWLGFGMIAVDAVRGLEPVMGRDLKIEFRNAGTGDIEQILELHEGLRQHVKRSPDFFILEEHNTGYIENWLNDPERAIWLALVDGDPAAFIRIGPANDDVATIIFDAGTTSIYGAFTLSSMRGRGIGTALLGHAIEAARGKGYVRCAVDFEPMNTIGTRFWLGKGFRPVCLSLLRYVDERVI